MRAACSSAQLCLRHPQGMNVDLGSALQLEAFRRQKTSGQQAKASQSSATPVSRSGSTAPSSITPSDGQAGAGSSPVPPVSTAAVPLTEPSSSQGPEPLSHGGHESTSAAADGQTAGQHDSNRQQLGGGVSTDASATGPSGQTAAKVQHLVPARTGTGSPAPLEGSSTAMISLHRPDGALPHPASSSSQAGRFPPLPKPPQLPATLLQQGRLPGSTSGSTTPAQRLLSGAYLASWTPLDAVHGLPDC